MQHDFILLDRSGSMAEGGRWPELLNAINGYVKKLADDNVDTGVTLAAFDKQGDKLDYAVVRDRITPKTWKPVTDTEVAPRGYTPLNDAIGRLVASAEAGHNGVAYDKVAIIILTDGQENASREVSVHQAKALLDRCRAKGWQVIFLGADFDNVVQATSYGTMSRQTVSSISPQSLGMAFAQTAAKRGLYASGAAATMDWSDDDKADLAQNAQNPKK